MRFTYGMGSLAMIVGLAVGAPAGAAAVSVPATPDLRITATASPPQTKPSPVRAPVPASGGHGPGGSMAETGGSGERLWLLGGLALALAATGVVAKAAMHGRREL